MLSLIAFSLEMIKMAANTGKAFAPPSPPANFQKPHKERLFLVNLFFTLLDRPFFYKNEFKTHTLAENENPKTQHRGE